MWILKVIGVLLRDFGKEILRGLGLERSGELIDWKLNSFAPIKDDLKREVPEWNVFLYHSMAFSY